MRAALIEELGRPPVLGEAPEPEPAPGEVVVDVVCVPLNPIDIAIGAGRFYGGHPPLPYVPGREAIGRVRGGLVWVNGAPGGTLAERVAAPESALTPVPEGAEPAVAGACGIAGLAGWLPVVWRVPVREGDRVLVLGATGTVGLTALQGARLQGAARVVAAGRDPERLERAARLGADATVRLEPLEGLPDRIREAFEGAGPTHVVDPLWGAPLVAALEAAERGARIVHIGQSAGAEASIPSSLVRGKVLDVHGYSNFAVPDEVLRREYRRLAGHAARGEVRLEVERFPFERVAEAWELQASGSPPAKIVVDVETG